MIKINAEKTIRNINLYLLSDIELEEPYLTVYNMLNNQFSNMHIYKCYNEIYYGTSKSKLYFRYFVLDSYPILLNYNNSFNFLEVINDKYIIADDDIIKILIYYFYLKFNISDRNILCPKTQGALYIKSLENYTIIR